MNNDKEQLAKLKGAQAAMSAALNRIDRLERALGLQRDFVQNLRKTLGTDLHASFYRMGDYKVLPIHAVLDEQIDSIKKELS